MNRLKLQVLKSKQAYLEKKAAASPNTTSPALSSSAYAEKPESPEKKSSPETLDYSDALRQLRAKYNKHVDDIYDDAINTPRQDAGDHGPTSLKDGATTQTVEDTIATGPQLTVTQPSDKLPTKEERKRFVLGSPRASSNFN